jgi:phage tail-like protein
MPGTALTSDPIISSYVGVEIQGAMSGYFTEVSGAEITTEVVEHWTNTVDGKQTVQRKTPGRTTYGDITLKRGVVKDNKELYDWHKMVRDGNIEGARKSGSIFLMDQAHTEIARWNFEACWPSKVVLPSLSADAAAAIVEEVTLTVEYIERTK